jgi:hypothetical protein
VLSLFAFGVSTHYANAGPPPKVIALPAEVQLPEDIAIVVVEKGDTISLVVNKATPIKVEKDK